jgi:hypothetical protein
MSKEGTIFQHNGYEDNTPPAFTKQEMEFWRNYFSPLIGAELLYVVLVTDDDTDEWCKPTPVLIMKNGTHIFNVHILSDEEGNDSGHLDIHQITQETK